MTAGQLASRARPAARAGSLFPEIERGGIER